MHQGKPITVKRVSALVSGTWIRLTISSDFIIPAHPANTKHDLLPVAAVPSLVGHDWEKKLAGLISARHFLSTSNDISFICSFTILGDRLSDAESHFSSPRHFSNRTRLPFYSRCPLTGKSCRTRKRICLQLVYQCCLHSFAVSVDAVVKSVFICWFVAFSHSSFMWGEMQSVPRPSSIC